MSRKLDQLLEAERTASASLDAARAAVKAELKRPRPRSWRLDAALLLGAVWGLAGLVALALLATGNTGLELFARHGASLGLLLAVGTASAWAALAPPSRGRLGFAVAMGASGLLGLVLLRGLGATSLGTQPEWVCTLTHLGAGAAPLAVALVMLKKSAPHPVRAVLAGVAVGTCGALIGELGCAQPWQHVLVFHVSAWVALIAACAVVARRLERSSYAP